MMSFRRLRISFKREQESAQGAIPETPNQRLLIYDQTRFPEERSDREQIQRDPPQILLTNYTMLEYLLVRQKDREMFLKTPPRFLILDEIHTYVGILGTEVACLIRRFKEHARIPTGQICCVGTSATLISNKAELGTHPYASLITFAESLFGEHFDDWKHSIIDEEYQDLPQDP